MEVRLDDKFAKRVDSLAADAGVTRAETIRALLRRGLEDFEWLPTPDAEA